MRAKTINFEEDLNPYDALRVGKWHNLKHGDAIRVLDEVYYIADDMAFYLFDDICCEEGHEVKELKFDVMDILYYNEEEDQFLGGELWGPDREWVIERKDAFEFVRIQENLNFEEDIDPYKSLKIGKHKFKEFVDIKSGDIAIGPGDNKYIVVTTGTGYWDFIANGGKFDTNGAMGMFFRESDHNGWEEKVQWIALKDEHAMGGYIYSVCDISDDYYQVLNN